MHFKGFSQEDFDAFSIPGLEPRMEMLKKTLRPKLEQLGEDVAPMLAEILGETMFAHVAKHARRTINPPDSTWVAFSNTKKSYKSSPHFQIGAWKSHVFLQFGLIYECTSKPSFARKMLDNIDEVRSEIPSTYKWLPDHTKVEGTLGGAMTEQDFRVLAERLATRKNAELMVGLDVLAKQATVMAPAAFLELVSDTFTRLSPLYKMAMSVEV